jgi:excisionase family DNA binding protein
MATGERREPYTVAELAELWRLDPSTVYRMIYAGRLRAERHGPRRGAIRVTADAVADYLASAAGAVA